MNIPKSLQNEIQKAPLTAGILALSDYKNGVHCEILVNRLRRLTNRSTGIANPSSNTIRVSRQKLF